MDTTAVLVLGMHRSGTSALTRLIHLLGVPAGPSGELMEAAPSNTSGHWEVTRLTDLDDRLLQTVGARWSGPPERGVTAAAAGDDLVAEAGETWQAVFAGGDAVWKDPRACLTLPFWRSVLPRSTVAVVVLRDPGEVAASLAARNGFSTAYGLALWERHLRLLLQGARGMPVQVVRYGDLLEYPASIGAQVAIFLEDHLSITTDDHTRREAWASVEPGQRHHHGDRPGLSAQQKALAQMADGLVGTHGVLAAVDLPDETPGLSLAFAEHARMGVFEDDALRLVGEKAGLEDELSRQIEVLTAEIEARSAEASTLADDVIAARAQVAELEQVLDRIRRRMPYRAFQAGKRLLGRSDPST
jgi:hypothetical protein